MMVSEWAKRLSFYQERYSYCFGKTFDHKRLLKGCIEGFYGRCLVSKELVFIKVPTWEESTLRLLAVVEDVLWYSPQFQYTLTV